MDICSSHPVSTKDLMEVLGAGSDTLIYIVELTQASLSLLWEVDPGTYAGSCTVVVRSKKINCLFPVTVRKKIG